MVSASVLQRILLLFPFAVPTPAPSSDHGSEEWSYDNTDSWDIDFPTCNGYRQSPINIRTAGSYYIPLPPLSFHDYDVPLMMPLILENNGHTINLDIPPTRNGKRPSITGGKLLDRYEAVGLHFHWGSPNKRGSEHLINGVRYDAEMHIVHKNVRYATVEEAQQYEDGLSVLGVLLRKEQNPNHFYPGLTKIFNRLPALVEFESESIIRGRFTLSQVLGDLNTKQFYTYKGSLTTPPCSQAVTWNVFPQALPIAASQIDKFYDLINSHNEPMIDNYRPVQPLDGRKVIFRTAGFPLFKSNAFN